MSLKPNWLARELADASKRVDELPKWAGGRGVTHERVEQLEEEIATLRAKHEQLRQRYSELVKAQSGDYYDMQSSAYTIAALHERVARLKAALQRAREEHAKAVVEGHRRRRG